jgi:uncharacterized protein (DUF1778 family)
LVQVAEAEAIVEQERLVLVTQEEQAEMAEAVAEPPITQAQAALVALA